MQLTSINFLVWRWHMDQYFNAYAVLSIFCKNYMELKKGLPIRPSEMGVLNIITGKEGPHTPVILADLLGASKQMITAHITSLERKGYITKAPQHRTSGFIIFFLPIRHWNWSRAPMLSYMETYLFGKQTRSEGLSYVSGSGWKSECYSGNK